jgi:hypothetical protein
MAKTSASLRKLVDELMVMLPGEIAYYNGSSGEIVLRQADAPGFHRLPDADQIDEHHIMQRFCRTIDDYFIQDALLRSIRKKRSIRQFHKTVEQFGLKDDWLDFREKAFKEIAIMWLEMHKIPYDDDTA